MYSKVYEKIKQYLQENIKPIIFFTLLYLCFTYPLPYHIYTSGGIMNINQKVTIDDEYQPKGSFNFAYVNELKGTIPTILLSYVIPSWELVKTEEGGTKTEEEEDVRYRDRLFLIDSIQNATTYVYKLLNKEVKITDRKFYVVYVAEEAMTNLKVKDEILSLNRVKMQDINDYLKAVEQTKIGDSISLLVKDETNMIKNKTIKVFNYQNHKITGIYIIPKLDYTTNPVITYHFTENESGPSGGLMLALTIYNKLTKEDITKGKRIVGTGTLDLNGNVGSISGLEYKLKAAVNKKADIFLAPSGNYQEALDLLDKNNYNIQILKVLTFSDALNYLQMMK
ncbi:MAG: hypothetical protein PHF47_03215 [Bacilli bacterium]|nr:hypothetical protein [Bacilli bacterium]